MNLPATPPVDFKNLAAIAPSDVKPDTSRALVVRKRSKAKPIAAAGLGLLTATGVLAWRAAITSRRSHTSELLVAGAAGVALIGLAAWQLQRLFAPQPSYEVELRDGDFEVRRYPSLRTVDTEVDATWDAALDEGFRRLARFIYGDNMEERKLPMTAPVLGTGDKFGYRLSFILGNDTLLPHPKDERIHVGWIPGRRVGVVRFRGRYNAYNLAAHKKDLAHALAVNHLRPRGEAVFAGYDPPTTLPLLRRNELWVELGEGTKQLA
jgi:hypothetical protein